MENPDHGSAVYDAWYAALVGNETEKALQIAARAYLKAVDERSKENSILFHRLVRLSIVEAWERSANNEMDAINKCSFCLDLIESKQHVLGPGVSICETCIATAVKLMR